MIIYTQPHPQAHAHSQVFRISQIYRQKVQAHDLACYNIIIILILQLSVRACVHPESITGSNLTPVEKLAFFASRSFDVTEAVELATARAEC